MIVTEEEAKTKMCQERFGPVQPAPVPSYSTEHNNPFGHSWSPVMGAVSMAPQTCLGSACMAWRWHNAAMPERWDRIIPHPDDRKARFLEGYGEDPNHIGGMRKKIAEAEPARGYCGKAHRPAM